MRIFIIEDEPSYIDLLLHHLEPAGYDCVVCDDGQEAVDTGPGLGPFDLVILDGWHLPGLSGPEVLVALRQTETFKTTPMIMISVAEWDLIRRYLPGDEHPVYMHKPIDFPRLLLTVAELIAQAGAPHVDA